MCTAISNIDGSHLFGRTLDVERSFGERVIAISREFRFHFLREGDADCHYTIIGIGCVRCGTPLFYDGINEKGVWVAGLNFPESAVYRSYVPGKKNLASFEVIPFLLSKCGSLKDAREILNNVNITNDCFSNDLPSTPLHWMVADKNGTLTVEAVADGVKIYENPFGVLTNEPPFPYHKCRVAELSFVSAEKPMNNICPNTDIEYYSCGMGGIGLPGDFSSASRFVRAVFTKSHTVSDEEDGVNRFFHIADTVSVPCGCVKTEKGEDLYTLYTSCADADKFVYYFTTYKNRQIRKAVFTDFNPSKDKIFSLELEKI